MTKRTTLTLEDDVAAQVRQEARRTGKPVKTVVNDALRRGLERSDGRKPVSFRVVPRDLGLRAGMDIDDIEGLLERVEGPLHR